MKELNIRINFDLDGTLADLYGVENWLDMLINHNPTPYAIAKPLIRLCVLARYLNKLQILGAKICVISWLAKTTTEEYNQQVTETKLQWLNKHLPSVKFDEINILPYGTPKERYCYNNNDILFDDEEENRNNWNGIAYNEKNILENLKKVLTNIK